MDNTHKNPNHQTAAATNHRLPPSSSQHLHRTTTHVNHGFTNSTTTTNPEDNKDTTSFSLLTTGGEKSTSTTTTTTPRPPPTAEETGRERLKRHRVEMAGRVWIPDIWGQEDLLNDWIDCTVFDSSLGNKTIISARTALVQEARSTLRIENRC